MKPETFARTNDSTVYKAADTPTLHNKADQVSILFDIEYFDSILNRPDIPQMQRHAALNELWHLIAMFIDVGWGVYPLSVYEGKASKNTDNPFNKTENLSNESGALDGDMVYSDCKLLIDQFAESLSKKEDNNDGFTR